MIARLKGIVDEVAKDRVIVDVNSVGYAVQVSAFDRERFPTLGAPVTLEIYSHVREDAFDLYGFLDKLDRELFAFVMEANGVGPKLALTILSNLEGEALLNALRFGKIESLTSIPGIGRKKAERLVLELQDKCEKRFADVLLKQGARAHDKDKKHSRSADSAAEWADDLLAALLGLGYRDMDVRRAIAHISKQENPPANLEIYLKECLKFLSANNARGLMGNA